MVISEDVNPIDLSEYQDGKQDSSLGGCLGTYGIVEWLCACMCMCMCLRIYIKKRSTSWLVLLNHFGSI